MYASFLKTDFPPQAQAGSEKGGGHFPSVIHGKKVRPFLCLKCVWLRSQPRFVKKDFPPILTLHDFL